MQWRKEPLGGSSAARVPDLCAKPLALSHNGVVFQEMVCCLGCYSIIIYCVNCIDETAIPTFPSTSSAELDAALNRFREELFVPFGLNVQQRKLMFRQKYHDRLDEEPVTVSIGENDEPFLLRPMDPLTRPTKQEAIETISLMKTPRDWQNLVPFLTGLRMANRILKRERWEWLIRRANNEADALGVIIECAKQSSKTGLRLDNEPVVQRLFFELHRKAQREDFQDPALSKTLGLAQEAVNLMEAPEHKPESLSQDPRRNPTVIAVMLELNAARALNPASAEGNSAADEYDGRTLAFALRLNGTLSKVKTEQPKTWREAEEQLRDNAPIYNAVRLALQVPSVSADKALSKELKNALQTLKSSLVTASGMAPAATKEKPTQGLEQAERLLSS